MHDFELIKYTTHRFVTSYIQYIEYACLSLILGLVIALVLSHVLKDHKSIYIFMYYLLASLIIFSMFIFISHSNVKDKKFDVKYQAIVEVDHYDTSTNHLIIQLNEHKEEININENNVYLNDASIHSGDKVKIILHKNIDFDSKPKIGDHQSIDEILKSNQSSISNLTLSNNSNEINIYQY